MRSIETTALRVVDAARRAPTVCEADTRAAELIRPLVLRYACASGAVMFVVGVVVGYWL